MITATVKVSVFTKWIGIIELDTLDELDQAISLDYMVLIEEKEVK